ncbi:MAG: ribbon-helix-helix domain-containing protein [Schwartzia sp.]|nr:ribbon-helix-helix domain-containing protein [Schwartzia sp. (in: firmicutes)]
MADKLTAAELRRNATDFDPPDDSDTPCTQTLTEKNGVRFRVTASLTLRQHTMLKALSARLGLPMSRVLGLAVEALGKQY